MANVDVDSDQIQAACSTLNAAVGDIPTELTTLLNSVNSLLDTPEGGLWLSQTSPAFQSAYQQFTVSLNQAVAGIGSFSQQFTNIASQIIAMDAAIAKSVNGG
jgi:uncharacterized protein YukE